MITKEEAINIYNNMPKESKHIIDIIVQEKVKEQLNNEIVKQLNK